MTLPLPSTDPPIPLIEAESPTHVAFRGQGGEEIVVAAQPHEGATRVSGSSYLFDMQVARFLSMLPPAPDAAVAAGEGVA